jgi:hypothetical protein
MGQTYSFWRFFSVVLALLALTTVTFGQTSQSARNAAPAPSKSKVATPVTMTECEGVNTCATWTFLGKQGTGQWPSGNIASLTVERYDNDSVVIRRADSTGSSAGLTAVYTGNRKGDRVGGEFTSSWPGHWGSESGYWYAILQKPQSLPPVMRVCGNPNDWNVCSTWTWNNGHYDGWREWGAVATMTVVSFTREAVVIERTDTGPAGPGHPGAGFRMVYRGTISSTGDSILDGVSEGGGGASGPAGGPFRAYWGAALQNLPPAEHPGQPSQQLVVVPVVPVMPAVCFPWFFGVVCGP